MIRFGIMGDGRGAVRLRAALFLAALLAMVGAPLGAAEPIFQRGHLLERDAGEAWSGDLPPRYAKLGGPAVAELVEGHGHAVVDLVLGGADGLARPPAPLSQPAPGDAPRPAARVEAPRAPAPHGFSPRAPPAA